MNRTLIKDSIRNIWKKKITALSIAVVITLSVGVFLGIFFYMKALYKEGEIYYKEQNFKDFDIYSSQGISQEEIDRLKLVEDISDLEGIYTASAKYVKDGKSKSLTIYNLTERISLPRLIEGELPDAENEMAVSYDYAKANGIKIGDVITFSLSEDEQKLLKNDTYTVTGLITHPNNLRSSVSNIAVVPISSFDMESNNNYYMAAIAKADYYSGLDIFSDDYFEYMNQIQADLEKELENIRIEHTLEVKSVAEQELNDNKEKADKEITNAQNQIDDGWDEYDKKVKEGEDALNDARSKISYYEGYIARGEEDLNKMSSIYNSNVTPMQEKMNAMKEKSQVDSEKEKEIDDFIYDNASPTDAIMEDYTNLKDRRTEIEDEVTESLDSYNSMSENFAKQISNGRAEIAQGKNTLAGYKAELTEKEKEFEDAKKDGQDKLNDAQSQLDEKKEEAETKIAEAEGQIESIETTNYMVFNRKTNYGYVDLSSNLQTVKASAYCFALMFVIIGILVCFSSIYIIIDEQKELVGTEKSMGFFNRTIRVKYLIYGISSVVVGILLGIVLELVLQFIFQKSIGDMYIFGTPDTYFSLAPALFIITTNVLVAIIATHMACRKLLKFSAVQLMNGETGNVGKKKKSKSKTKKNLYSKLIIRNIITAKERVAISIVIIAGSCFVVGIGFSLKYANKDMINRQLYYVQNYDISVSYSASKDGEKIDELVSFMGDNGIDSAKIATVSTMYNVRGNQDYLRVIVAEPDTFDNFYNIIDFKSGKRISLANDGAIIQSRFSEVNSVRNGDLIRVYDTKFNEYTIKVDGVFTNYAGKDMLMTPDYYRNVFGKSATQSTLLIKLNGTDGAGIIEKIQKDIPEASISTPQQTLNNYRTTFLIYDLIIMIMTFLAIVLSLFVLSNITNIFVNGKKNELIIMRINGFSTSQSIGYLIRENALTIILSLIIAVVAGIFLNRFVIGLFETDATMLVRSFNPKAWLIAIVFELVFTLIIDFISFRKVKTFKVTDINS